MMRATSYSIIISAGLLKSLDTALRQSFPLRAWCTSEITTPTTLAPLISIRHFGKEVISGRTQLAVEDPKVETLWLKMYRVC